MLLDMPWLLRRHMKSSGRYFDPSSMATPPVTAAQVPTGETLIGWYCNPLPWETTVLSFTDQSILYSDGGALVRLAYDDILGYNHTNTKSDINGIELKTTSGSQFIRVGGRWGEGGRFIDAFKFIMILQAVLGARINP